MHAPAFYSQMLHQLHSHVNSLTVFAYLPLPLPLTLLRPLYQTLETRAFRWFLFAFSLQKFSSSFVGDRAKCLSPCGLIAGTGGLSGTEGVDGI